MGSLEAIAERAGCSARTVANVLSGKNKENWPSTVRRAERIRRIALEMGYRPNAAARAMRTGRFDTVGLLRPASHSGALLFGQSLLEAERHLSARGINLMLGDLPDSAIESLDSFDDLSGHVASGHACDGEASDDWDASTPELLEAPHMLRQWMVDGILLSYFLTNNAGRYARLLRGLSDRALPWVTLNARDEFNCVYPDDYGAALEATRLFLRRGHRRIVFAQMVATTHFSGADRQNGYRCAMREAGLEPRVWEFNAPPRTGARDGRFYREALDRLLEPERPTAIVYYELDRATALFGAAGQLGLRVPQQLSLLAFHEVAGEVCGLPIDTMRIPARELGRHAADMLLRRIEAPIDYPSLSVPAVMLAGATIADAPCLGGSSK